MRKAGTGAARVAGYVYGRGGRAIGAYAYRAIELSLNDAAAYYNRGAMKIQSGDRTAAREDYERVIELDQNGAAAYNNRGVSKAELGDEPEAAENFKKARELGYSP